MTKTTDLIKENPNIKFKDEKLFALFRRLETHDSFKIFHKELRMSRGLEGYFFTVIKAYRKKKRPYQTTKKDPEDYTNRNKIYVNQGLNSYTLRGLSRFETGLMHAWILQEYANEYHSSLNASPYADQVNNLEGPSLKQVFNSLFPELISFETNSPISLEFKTIITSLYKKDDFYNEDFVYYMYKAFLIVFIRSQHRNKGKAAISRSNLTYEIGLAITTFIIYTLNNKNLNDFLQDLTYENFNQISDKHLSFVKEFYYATLVDDSSENKTNAVITFFEQTFTYTTKKVVENVMEEVIIKVDPIYINILTLHIKDIIFNLLYTYPIFARDKFEDIKFKGDLFEDFRKEYRVRLVQYGNLFLDCAIKNNICYAELLSKGPKTISIIHLTNSLSLAHLQEIFQYKKPQLLEKPYSLHEMNTRFEHVYNVLNLKETLPGFTILTVIEEKDLRHRIHTNADIRLFPARGHSINSFVPKTRYTIDLDMLRLFLLEIEKVQLPQLMDINDMYYNDILSIMTHSLQEHFDNILMLYDFSFKQLHVLLSKYPKTNDNLNDLFYKALSHMLRYMLSFNTITYLQIQEDVLPPQPFNGKAVIKELFDKILQYKVFIVGLIKDAIIYSHFEYFVANSFLDSRGRLYNREVFLNIQNNPIAKMFVKLYNNPEKQHFSYKVWYKIKGYLSEFATYNSSKEHLAFASNIYDDKNMSLFKERNAVLVQEYISSYFDLKLFTKDTNENYDFNKLLNMSLDEQLTFVKKYIKKKKKLWIVIQKLKAYAAGDLFQVIELDANNSGSQMISILLLNQKLAKECNLIGQESFDAYTQILTGYNDILISLNLLLNYCNPLMFIYKQELQDEPIYNHILLKDYNDYKQGLYSREDMALKIFPMVLHANLKLSTGFKLAFQLLFQVLDLTHIDYNQLTKYLNVIPKNERELVESHFKDYNKEFRDFCTTILVLRIAFNLNCYYTNYTWLNPTETIWMDRDLFKKPIMTLYYNATRYTRIQHFDDFFKAYSRKYNKNIKNNSFVYLSNFTELFFRDFTRTHLYGNLSMQKLTTMLYAKKESIHISNGYFNIKINPTLKKSIQVESKTIKNKRQQISIRLPTRNLNNKKLKQTLSPNIIHSMDAYIVHKFIEKVVTINNIIKGDGFILKYYINHDNFACNMPFILPILLKECYYELTCTDYLSFIRELTEQERIELRAGDTKTFSEAFKTNSNPLFVK